MKPREELGGTRGERGRGGGHHRHLQSAPNGPQSPEPGMESPRADGAARLCQANGRLRVSGNAGAMSARHRGHLHLRRAVIFLVALTIQPQVSHRLSSISGGMRFKTTTLSVMFAYVFSLICAKRPLKKPAATVSPHAAVLSSAHACMALRPPVVSARCSLLSRTTQNCSNPVLDAWNANITAKTTFGTLNYKALKLSHTFFFAK